MPVVVLAVVLVGLEVMEVVVVLVGAIITSCGTTATRVGSAVGGTLSSIASALGSRTVPASSMMSFRSSTIW